MKVSIELNYEQLLISIEAASIQKELLRKNKIIGFADIAIAATAKVHRLEIATLNEKHFSRIAGLKLIAYEGKQ